MSRPRRDLAELNDSVIDRQEVPGVHRCASRHGSVAAQLRGDLAMAYPKLRAYPVPAWHSVR